jgi:glycosyltransferase 2 family protein
VSSRRKRLLLAGRIAVWLVVIGCVVMFARNLRWHAVRASFHAADTGLLLVAIFLWIPCTALQAVRWYSLVRAVAKVRFLTVLSCAYVGYAASAVLPMRAGEAVRIELLARSAGLPRAVAVGTVAIDHTVNGVVMFLLASTLPLFLPLPIWTRIVLWSGVGIAAALFLVMLRLARKPSLRQKPPGKVMEVVLRLRAGLVGLRRPRSLVGGFAGALGAWTLEIACTMAALAAFHLPHGVSHAMAVLFGVNLALAMPAPPANLGNFELGAGFALVGLGADRDQAAAFALGLHALQVLPTLLVGAIALLRFRGRQLAAAAHVAAHPPEVEQATLELAQNPQVIAAEDAVQLGGGEPSSGKRFG